MGQLKIRFDGLMVDSDLSLGLVNPCDGIRDGVAIVWFPVVLLDAFLSWFDKFLDLALLAVDNTGCFDGVV